MTFVPPKLRHWFKRKPKPVVRLTFRSASTLTLAEWQSSELLAAEGKRLLEDKSFRLAFDMLRNESPVNYGLPDLGVAATDRIVHQAKTEGYQLCLNNLEALGTLKVTDQPLQATFAPPENESLP
jgi:hypothetical protein